MAAPGQAGQCPLVAAVGQQELSSQLCVSGFGRHGEKFMPFLSRIVKILRCSLWRWEPAAVRCPGEARSRGQPLRCGGCRSGRQGWGGHNGKATAPCPRHCRGSSSSRPGTGSPLLEHLPCAMSPVLATCCGAVGRLGGFNGASPLDAASTLWLDWGWGSFRGK